MLNFSQALDLYLFLLFHHHRWRIEFLASYLVLLPSLCRTNLTFFFLVGIAVGDAKGISYETLTKEEIAEATKTEDQGCYHKVHTNTILFLYFSEVIAFCVGSQAEQVHPTGLPCWKMDRRHSSTTKILYSWFCFSNLELFCVVDFGCCSCADQRKRIRYGPDSQRAHQSK